MTSWQHSDLFSTPGDLRLRSLREALQFIDDGPSQFKRSTQQKQMHDAFINACLRNIYKTEFAANQMRILEENNWDATRQELLVTAPSRCGKTTAICMFAAAYAMTQPNCKLCILSPGRRHSEMLLERVKEFVAMFPQSKVTKFNKATLWLQGDNEVYDIRKISAYPMPPDRLCGVGGDILICDEAAEMDMSTFYTIVVPLWSVDEEVALLCTSTIKDGDN